MPAAHLDAGRSVKTRTKRKQRPHAVDGATGSPAIPATTSLGLEDLPTEVLIEILCTILDVPLASYYAQLRELRLVCKKWNNVITSSPTFWTVLHTQHGDAHVDYILVRSAGLALSVCIARCEPDFLRYHTYQNVFSSMPRWRSADVDISLSNQVQFLDAVRNPAPFLKALNLTWSRDIDITPLLFLGSSGRSWFPNLTNLTVDAAVSDLNRLLRGLSLCPNLRVINLTSSSIISNETPADTTLSFPVLEEFRLPPCTVGQLNSVLRSLQAPKCTTVYAELKKVQTQGPAAVPELDALDGSLIWSVPVFDAIRKVASSRASVTVEDDYVGILLYNNQRRIHVPLFQIRCHFIDPPLLHWMRALLESIGNLVWTRLNIPPALTNEAFAPNQGFSLPAVKELRLKVGTAETYAARWLLHLSVPWKVEDDCPIFPFPTLERLYIEYTLHQQDLNQVLRLVSARYSAEVASRPLPLKFISVINWTGKDVESLTKLRNLVGVGRVDVTTSPNALTIFYTE